MELIYVLGIYLAVISLVAIVVTVIDKVNARRGAWRISESSLIIISVFGGSVAMYITMHLIRHKTRHAKFMVGIPIIIALQIAAAVALWILK